MPEGVGVAGAERLGVLSTEEMGEKTLHPLMMERQIPTESRAQMIFLMMPILECPTPRAFTVNQRMLFRLHRL